MAPLEEMQQANINRSIRTIKAELEYLCDASVITPTTLSDLLSRIPSQTQLHAPLSVGALPTVTSPPANTNGVSNGLNNMNLKERASSFMNEKQEYNPPASPQPPPPAYNAPPPQAQWAPSAPPLAQAMALYQYSSADAGDLELQPNDHIAVTEYMNAEWWKGRSTRTGQEGIFPRSYVKVTEDKASTSNNYGNAPLAVSGMGNGKSPIPQAL